MALSHMPRGSVGSQETLCQQCLSITDETLRHKIKWQLAFFNISMMQNVVITGTYGVEVYKSTKPSVKRMWICSLIERLLTSFNGHLYTIHTFLLRVHSAILMQWDDTWSHTSSFRAPDAILSYYLFNMLCDAPLTKQPITSVCIYLIRLHFNKCPWRIIFMSVTASENTGESTIQRFVCVNNKGIIETPNYSAFDKRGIHRWLVASPHVWSYVLPMRTYFCVCLCYGVCRPTAIAGTLLCYQISVTHVKIAYLWKSMYGYPTLKSVRVTWLIAWKLSCYWFKGRRQRYNTYIFHCSGHCGMISAHC